MSNIRNSTETQLRETLRQYADIASAGDKPHWADAMRQAAQQIAMLENIAEAASKLCGAIEIGLTQDKQIPIARELCNLLDEIARRSEAASRHAIDRAAAQIAEAS